MTQDPPAGPEEPPTGPEPPQHLYGPPVTAGALPSSPQPDPWSGAPPAPGPWGPPAAYAGWASAAYGPGGPGGGGEPARRPPYPHPEPREYHQMYRTWTYRWWRPVVGIIGLAAGMTVVLPVVLLPVLVVGVLLEGGGDDFGDALSRAASFKELTASSMLYLNLTLGGLILWTWLLVRVLHQMRPRWLSSVQPRLRWRYLGACVGLALVALVSSVVVGGLVPGAADPSVSVDGVSFTSRTAALGVVILLTTPLQAIGEEYAFRGYLLQAVGSLTRSRWVALVVTSTLFAMAHGIQNFPLFFDRFMFGLVAGWLVIRTGGLEAGIAMHVLNNYVAFGLALAFSDIDQTLNVSEVSWWNIPVTLTQSVTYAALAAWVAHRMRLRTRTEVPGPPATQELATAGLDARFGGDRS